MYNINECSEDQSEQIIIDRLKNKTSQIIKSWERPEYVFEIDKTKTALIVVDMQNYYLSFTKDFYFINIDEVIININLLVDKCHKNDVPVIWLRNNFTVNDNFDDSGYYPDFHKQPLCPDLCNMHKGTDVFSKLHIDESKDYQVTKNRYSPFINNSSKLEELLNTLDKKQIIITGIVANVCVESLVRDAMQMNYQVILVSDAVSSFDRIILEASLMVMKLFFADVVTTQNILEKLDKNQ